MAWPPSHLGPGVTGRPGQGQGRLGVVSEARVVFILEPALKVRKELRRDVLVSVAGVTRGHTRRGS